MDQTPTHRHTTVGTFQSLFTGNVHTHCGDIRFRLLDWKMNFENQGIPMKEINVARQAEKVGGSTSLKEKRFWLKKPNSSNQIKVRQFIWRKIPRNAFLSPDTEAVLPNDGCATNFKCTNNWWAIASSCADNGKHPCAVLAFTHNACHTLHTMQVWIEVISIQRERKSPGQVTKSEDSIEFEKRQTITQTRLSE